MLGLRVSFPGAWADERIIVENTVERVAEVRSVVDEIMGAISCGVREPASLLGRVNFMTTQTWSRAGLLFTRALRMRAVGNEVKWQDLAYSLQCIREILQSPPREVRVQVSPKPVWVYTDAAVEGDSMTIGGVLAVPGMPLRHFSASIPSIVKSLWQESRQPITYAESLAALCVDVVLAVDNIGAQQSLIRYQTSSETLRAIVKAHLVVDAKHLFRVWVTWVPSESNIADGPSRLDNSSVEALGSVLDHVSETLWQGVLVLMSLSDVAAARAFSSALGHK
eukprot:6461149-Amphidinium_carterae.1